MIQFKKNSTECNETNSLYPDSVSVAALQDSRRGVMANRGHGRLRLFSLSFLSVPVVILLFLSFLVIALPAAATDPGSLDTTFGGTGMAITDFGGNDSSQSVAIQSDGKIVAVGVYGATSSTGDFAVARYNIDGSLDTTFGIGGRVTTSFGSSGRDQAWAVAIQSDGKIVVVGDTTAFGRNVFALARYNTHGSLDATFGGTGKVTTAFGISGDISPLAQGFSVALQSDDKIVVAGAFFKFYSTNWNFALARYNADGSLDATFGGTGKLITDFSGGNDAANSVIIQSDGKIVAAGYSTAVGNTDFALVRYNTDGALDTTFGSGTGKVTTDFGSATDYGYSVDIQGDGKMVVGGYSGGYPSADFALARYNTDGTLDISFGGTGKVTTNFGGFDLGQSVAIQSDGRIIAAGYTQSASYALDFAVARYNADGSLDADFGAGGKVTTDFGGGQDAGYSVAIQSDGKIVVAGHGGAARTDFAVARYGGAALPSNSPPLADAGNNVIITSDQVDATIILGSATDPDEDALTYRWLEGATVLQDWSDVGTNGEATLDLSSLPGVSIGNHTLTLEVADGTATSSDQTILTVGNSAPHASPTGDGIYQINSLVSIGGQVSDFDGDLLSYQWLEEANSLFSGTIQAVPGGNPVSLTPEIINDLALGTHILTLLVNDGINPAVSGSVTVLIVDTVAPTLAPVPDKTILWPPNHKMVTVTIFPNASDNSGNPVTLTASVISNEPQDGLGDGDVSPDWTVPVINNGVIALQLRAERSGKGTGRIYTITITATDEANNSSTAQVKVFVPHDEKGK